MGFKAVIKKNIDNPVTHTSIKKNEEDLESITRNSVNTKFNHFKILIGCPVRNREWILNDYLESIKKLNFPKKNISLCFIVNDSTDNSERILRIFQNNNIKKYDNILILTKNLNTPVDNRSGTVRNILYGSLANLRNHLLDVAKILNVDYLFSIDSDILVSSNSLVDLLECNKDIISMQIWNDERKIFPNILIKNPDSTKKAEFVHYKKFPTNSIFECDATGACYLLSKNVFENVKYSWHVQGEDMAFCKDAKDLNYEIWCNPLIKCEHYLNKDEYLKLKK